MGKLSVIASATLCCCLAGCGERPAADNASATNAATPPAAEQDTGERVLDRFNCEADTHVVMLDDRTARVSLPGGERHTLARVADSDPQVYTGDSLYFTIQADSAHLSQQDGARELACTRAIDAD